MSRRERRVTGVCRRSHAANHHRLAAAPPAAGGGWGEGRRGQRAARSWLPSSCTRQA